MKRERFVDMEAFSRSIMLRLDGFVSEACLPARTMLGMSTKASASKAPDRFLKIRLMGFIVKFAQTKTALHQGDKRGIETPITRGKLKQPVR